MDRSQGAASSARRPSYSALSVIREYEQLITRFQIGELKAGGRRSDVVRALLNHLSQLRAIGAAATSGNSLLARRKLDRALRSFNSRLSAVAATAAAGHFSDLSPHAFSYVDLIERANALNCFEASCGHMKVHRRRKDDGSFRAIASLSGDVRAAGRLVSDVLLAHFPESAINFTTPRKGRSAAAIAIKEAVQDGFATWIVFDIANFYPSIKPNHLEGQPLPRQVLRNVVFANRYLPIYGDNDTSFTEAVRQGLPVGATPSPIFASSLIEGLLREFVGEHHRVIVYGDDVAIGACAPEGMDKIAKAIKSGLETNPAGPLQLKHIGVYNAAESGLEILGYRFQGSPATGCNVTLAQRSFHRLRLRILDRLDSSNCKTFEQKLSIAEAYAESWCASHRPIPAHQLVEFAGLWALEAANDHGNLRKPKEISVGVKP
jgi:hypothetical protein